MQINACLKSSVPQLDNVKPTQNFRHAVFFGLNCPLCIFLPLVANESMSTDCTGFSDALQINGILWLGPSLRWHLVVPCGVGCWLPGGTAPARATQPPGLLHSPALTDNNQHSLIITSTNQHTSPREVALAWGSWMPKWGNKTSPPHAKSLPLYLQHRGKLQKSSFCA